MSRGLAAFIAGAGTGYFKSRERTEEKERQAKMDQIFLDRADRERRDDADQQDTKQRLMAANADAPAVTDASKPAADGVGPVMPTDDPNRFSVANTGVMTQDDATTAQMALQSKKTPEAKLAATAGVYRDKGMYDKAFQLEAGAADAKLKGFQLKEAEIAHIDKESNRAIEKKFQEAGNWVEGAASLLTETQIGKMAGVEVKPVISADKKTVDFVAVGPDGQSKVLRTYENGTKGESQVRQDFMKVDPTTRVQWLHERNKSEQAQANWEKDYAIKKNDSESQADYRKRSLSIAQAAESRASQTFKKQMEDDKFPPEVKQQLASIYDGKKAVLSAMYKSMAEDTYKADSPNAQQIVKDLKAFDTQAQALLEMHGKRPKAKGDEFGLATKPTVAQPSQTAPAAAQSAPVVVPAPVAAPAVTVATQGVPAAPAKPLSTLDQIKADNMAAVAPLAQKFKEAERRFVGAAQSGDQKSVSQYMQEKQVLRTELEKQLEAKFGNAAPAVMQQLLAQ